MISAKEARALVQTSDEVMTKRLEQIGVEVEKAAKLGKCSVILDDALPYDPFFRIEKRMCGPAGLNEAQRCLKQKLEDPKLGYMVGIIEQKHDGRGGLGMTDDDPEPFSTWHIRVSW